ncbi:MAG: tRNA pseudouridine synthase tRNA pseudouridsynthase [Candidatus Parcubacteria bacterium]|jgi:tRNA pseudouridine55 synthase
MKAGVVWKNIGETPLQAIRRFRIRNTIPDSIPLTYSGRLDPMADGKILVLVGDECKKESEYRSLEKEYLVEVLLQCSTDTGDILGIPNYTMPQNELVLRQPTLDSALQSLVGVHAWPYPHYSSKPVHGKPLHQWSREGKIDTIEIPRTKSHIKSIKVTSITHIHSGTLLSTIQKKINSLSLYNDNKPCPEFRQKEIAQAWEQLLVPNTTQFTIIHIRVVAGSGTYMRTLCEKIGQLLMTEGCALSIRRTKIGTRRNFFGFHFWWPRW